MDAKLDFLTHPVQLKAPTGGGIIVPTQVVADCSLVTDYNQSNPFDPRVFKQISTEVCSPGVFIPAPFTGVYFHHWFLFATVPSTIPAGNQVATIEGLPDLFPLAPSNPALQPPAGHVDDITATIAGLNITLQIPGIKLDLGNIQCGPAPTAFGHHFIPYDPGNVGLVSNGTVNFAGVQAVVEFGIQSVVYNLSRLVLGARISGDPLFGTATYGFNFTMVFRKVTR